MADRVTFTVEHIDDLAGTWQGGISAINTELRAAAMDTGRAIASSAWASWQAKVASRNGSTARMVVQDTERDAEQGADVKVGVVYVWMSHKTPNVPLWLEYGTRTHRAGKNRAAAVAVTARNWLGPSASGASGSFAAKVNDIVQRWIAKMNAGQ